MFESAEAFTHIDEIAGMDGHRRGDAGPVRPGAGAGRHGNARPEQGDRRAPFPADRGGHKYGKDVAMLVPTLEEAERWIAAGVKIIAYSSDAGRAAHRLHHRGAPPPAPRCVGTLLARSATNASVGGCGQPAGRLTRPPLACDSYVAMMISSAARASWPLLRGARSSSTAEQIAYQDLVGVLLIALALEEWGGLHFELLPLSSAVWQWERTWVEEHRSARAAQKASVPPVPLSSMRRYAFPPRSSLLHQFEGAGNPAVEPNHRGDVISGDEPGLANAGSDVTGGAVSPLRRDTAVTPACVAGEPAHHVEHVRAVNEQARAHRPADPASASRALRAAGRSCLPR